MWVTDQQRDSLIAQGLYYATGRIKISTNNQLGFAGEHSVCLYEVFPKWHRLEEERSRLSRD